MIQTRDQKFANAAIKRIKTLKSEEQKDYKSTAQSFPALLMQSGLAQAVGFLSAKNKMRYLEDLQLVLQAAGVMRAGNTDLQQQVIAVPLVEYRRLTRETLVAAGWLKRFAQAELKD